VRAEVDATGLEDDGGSAKSVHDVGKEGLEEALGIVMLRRGPKLRSKIVDNIGWGENHTNGGTSGDINICLY
jgi:hypothetical protein